MGRRDIGRKETKKAKKDTRKGPGASIMAPPPPAVEVIKRGKKEPREEAE